MTNNNQKILDKVRSERQTRERELFMRLAEAAEKIKDDISLQAGLVEYTDLSKQEIIDALELVIEYFDTID